MPNYAIIQNGVVVVNIIYYSTQPSNPPPGFDATHTAIQHDTACIGWTLVNGVLTPPATPTPTLAQQIVAMNMAAQVAVDASKGTFDRIAEALFTGATTVNDPVVQAWFKWRRDTRALISSTTLTALPPKPTDANGNVIYPAGT